MYLRNVLMEFGLSTEKAITMYEDNAAVILIAAEPQYHKGTRHVEVPHHYTRELVSRGIIKLVYKATTDQLADMLTKPLGPLKLRDMVTNMLGGARPRG